MKNRLPLIVIASFITVAIIIWIQPKIESTKPNASLPSCSRVMQCLNAPGEWQSKSPFCPATLAPYTVRQYDIKTKKLGYALNYEGCVEKPIIPPNFDVATKFGNNGLAKVQKNGKWGYINLKGEEIVKLYFDEIGDFDHGLAPAKANGKWTYFNVQGNPALLTRFDAVSGTWSSGLAAVQENGKWGYIDLKGETVVAPTYDQAADFRNGLAKVESGGKWGVIDARGTVLLPVLYDVIFSVVPETIAPEERAVPELLLAAANGRFGYFDIVTPVEGGKEIREIIPVLLHEAVKVRRDNNGAVQVYLAGAKSTLSEDIGTGEKTSVKGWFYLDGHGEKLRFDENGKAQLWRHNEWFYITNVGRLVK